MQSAQRGGVCRAESCAGRLRSEHLEEGFRTLRQTGLELQLDQNVRVEFRLELGSLSQTVDVVAAAPLVNTENSAKGDVVVRQELIEMPLNGRDFTDLAMLTAGVAPNAEDGRGSSMAINGARADNTNFLIDGFNNQSPRDAGPQARPNLDSMQEFKIQTSGYSAETGRLAGGVMNVVLKSGGNQFHGAAFEFLRNDAMDARNFFATTKSKLRRNQFGATLDGPVLIRNSITAATTRSSCSVGRVTANGRVRRVSASCRPFCREMATSPRSRRVKDPLATGVCNAANRAACFPENRIPRSRISPVALRVQEYFPLPNRPGQANNYYVDAGNPNDYDSYVTKIDQHITSSDTVSVRFLTRTTNGGNPWATSNLGTFSAYTANKQMIAGLSYTRTFTPTVINEARFGLTRTAIHGYGDHRVPTTTRNSAYPADLPIPK